MNETVDLEKPVVLEQAPAKPKKIMRILKLFFRLVILGGLIVFVWYFLATPFQPVGDPVEPFASHKFALAERVTYLFRLPKIGDGVIFDPAYEDGRDVNYIGIIIDITNDKNITSYMVVSKLGDPWKISRDKIKARLYYPTITQDHLESARLVDDKAWSAINWKLYINTSFLYELKHPEQMEFVASGPNTVVGRIKQEFVLSEGDYLEFSIEISDETPETLMGKYGYGEKQEVEILGQMVSVYSGTGGEAGAYPFKMFVLTNEGKSYFFNVSTFNYWAVVDQILSTFKFLDLPSTTPTSSPTEKPQTAIPLTYALPVGWRTETDLSKTFEIGYDPTKVEVKPLHLDNGLFITDVSGTKSIIGTFQMTDYNGGSRHVYLKQKMGESLIESDKLPDFREEEYLIQGKKCLVYNGYFISASGPVWGMCPISANKALFFNTTRDNLVATLKTIKFFPEK